MSLEIAVQYFLRNESFYGDGWKVQLDEDGIALGIGEINQRFIYYVKKEDGSYMVWVGTDNIDDWQARANAMIKELKLPILLTPTGVETPWGKYTPTLPCWVNLKKLLNPETYA